MIRSTMRTILRRRLNEVTADQWQDTDLNNLLNEGLKLCQKEQLKIDPQAFVYQAVSNLVANQDLYDKPAGIWHEVEVGIRTTAGGAYTVIKRDDWNVIRGGETTDTRYANLGQFFGIYPLVPTSITDGLRVLFVPTLDMAVDTDAPLLHPALHYSVLLWANLLAVGETSEPGKDITELLAQQINDFPQHFQFGGMPHTLQPTIEKGY